MKNWFPMSTLKQKSKQDFTLKNGAMILERLITSFNGDSLPFRIYSHQELILATDGFDESRSLQRDSSWIFYKGNHEDRIIAVKKFNTNMFGLTNVLDMAITDIIVASQMSKHKNILMFIGCCIETELPILVFEYTENGDYTRYLGGDIPLLQLDSRLKIACELADAITFSHQGTSRIVIHGAVNPRNVFLNDCNRAKLADFGISKLIPLGEDHVQGEDARGTPGYIAPESFFECRYLEKSDVYSFGATLFVLITGKRIHDLFTYEFGAHQRVDDEIKPVYWEIYNDEWHGDSIEDIYLSADDSRGGNEEQLKECAKLTRRCLRRDPDKRPCMVEVAKSLNSIRRLQF